MEFIKYSPFTSPPPKKRKKKKEKNKAKWKLVCLNLSSFLLNYCRSCMDSSATEG